MEHFLKDNWFKMIIAVVIILIGISIFYYYVVFVPQKEKARSEQQEKAKQEEQEKELLNKKLLDDCLIEAENNFRKDAMDLCFSLGYSEEEINDLKCVIPKNVEIVVEDQQNRRKEKESDCFKRYK